MSNVEKTPFSGINIDGIISYVFNISLIFSFNVSFVNISKSAASLCSLIAIWKCISTGFHPQVVVDVVEISDRNTP